MIIDVLVEINFNSEQTFSYAVPLNLINDIKIGKRVLVPFNNKTLEGFIVGINNDKKDLKYELKNILSIIDEEPVLNEEMLSLGKYISKKTVSNLISVYQTMLPSSLKAKNKNNKTKPKYETYVILIDNSYIPKNKSQEEILKILKQGETLKQILTKISTSSYDTLKKKNIIEEKQLEKYRIIIKEEQKEKKKELTKEQQYVVDEVVKSLNNFNPFLLYGVTGSGKTEVYMNIIDEVLKKDKEIIVLVPEISLTPQFVNTFKKRFGSLIAILHSGLSNGEKYDEWRKIERKEIKIVIGARSAIFAPLTNLGLIVIDEEHSDTYKQENNPKYNAIDVAIKRAKNSNCPLLLGSATPSIESYTRAKTGIYKLLTLKHRINNKMPKVTLVDMKYDASQKNKLLSNTLLKHMEQSLERNEQIIMLLNRRGYSTVISCHECGYTVKCPNCEIPLTYHKTGNKMVCHYCNYTTYKPLKCPECSSENINFFGIGTQKLEEIINDIFPTYKTVRMDIDTTSRKGSHEKIFSSFKNKEYDILIGTQMIAKGLDFENVTLVGVVNGDATLNIPDFRSAERTFDLLSQVSGRSGRGKKDGQVIIQGFNINHYSITTASIHDYEEFYKREINIRKKLNYPPFCNICLITISSTDNRLVYDQSFKIKNYLENEKLNITILGPTTSRIPKVNNKYYMQIVLKYKDTKELLDRILFIKKQNIKNKKISIDIDFNPNKI